jgi:excisionase family DNA binding protein
MEEIIFSINEVAAYLKIPKSTIYKLSEKGKIPSIKIGKQLRFRKSSLDKWFSEQEGLSRGRAEQSPAHSLAADAPSHPDTKNVLLVDDDIIVLKTISKLLAMLRYSVEAAQSGEEALEKIADSHFDLIIIDVRMPGMNGIETIKKIRERCFSGSRPRIKEIIITGYMDREAELEASRLGITDYVYKPFAIGEFIETVKRNSGIENIFS